MAAINILSQMKSFAPSPDYLGINTWESETVQTAYQNIGKSFERVNFDKGWRSTHKFSDKKRGVDLRFMYNKDGNYTALYIHFSPHKLCNNGTHNANDVTLFQGLSAISSLFYELGLNETKMNCFKFNMLELGVNFTSPHPPLKVLNSALFYADYMFKEHTKFHHYFTADVNSKRGTVNKGTKKREGYMKCKFYWKSQQRVTAINLSYFQLGYCTEDILRLEFKIKNFKKFLSTKRGKKLGLVYLSDLFKDNIGDRINDFILSEYDKEVFFYNPEDIDTSKLKPLAKSHFIMWKNPRFWEISTARNCNNAKKKYAEMPKKSDIKEEVRNAIKSKFQDLYFQHLNSLHQKQKRSFFPPKFEGLKINKKCRYSFNKRHKRMVKHLRHPIDVGRTTEKEIQSHSKQTKVCEITGLDISMQKPQSKFLFKTGLEFYYNHEPDTYQKLCSEYLTEEKRNAELQQQFYYLSHNIRNAKNNAIHNRKSFEQRNYPSNQLSLF